MGNITELFDEETIEELKDKEKVLIFDGHNVAYRNVHTAVHFQPEDNEDFYFWRHLMMNSLLTTIKQFKPNKVIVAFDEKNSWRYDIFDGYKSKRKKSRDKSVVDFKKFYVALNSFIEEFKETFSNIYTIRLPRTEGDDTIGVLVKEKFKDNEVVIISSDKDLNQLLVNPNVKQYDPIACKFLECINPNKDLAIKILSGDRSDCIPSIKPLIGPKRAEGILKEGFRTWIENIEDETEKKTIEANFVRNKKLIDLSKIPENIKFEIINTYDTYKISPINGMKLVSFFSRNRMAKHMEDWQGYSDLIKSLS